VSLTVLLTALVVVLAVELPDKTLLATVVLATRYRPLPVLAGVSAAFFVQCLVAVTAGRALTLLPHRVVAAVVAALFLVGALLLLRGGDEEEFSPRDDNGSGWHRAATAFGVVFAAEWGDASQLATAALTARYHDILAVFTGSFVALIAVAALAVKIGNALTRRIPVRLIRRAAGLLFLAFTVIATIEAIHG
jgi:putative Ca2+/H+ antiporter (TMEM165/GDT1 family)